MSAVFVDTGAWFARFVPTDPDHPAAKGWLDRNTSPLITTDYIVDELLTLLKVRGEYQRALKVGPNLFGAAVCDLEWVTPADNVELRLPDGSGYPPSRSRFAL